MTIRIEQLEATSRGTVERLCELRDRVYVDDDRWRRPPDEKMERGLRRPAFSGQQRVLIARRPGKDVASAVVRHSSKLCPDDQPVATIGEFEAADDREAVGELFEAASKWAKQRGCRRIVGPMNGDTWYGYRLNLGPRAEPPFFAEPYNPPYYRRLWEESDFETVATYHTRCIDDVSAAARRHHPRWARARALGYRLEAMGQYTVEQRLDRLYELVTEIFSDACLYTPIRRAAFKKQHAELAELLDGKSSHFLVDRNGDDAGFVCVVPDHVRQLQAESGRAKLWAKARVLTGRSGDVADVRAFGIRPDLRGRKIASALMHRTLDAIVRSGFSRANICLVHDDVDSAELDAGGGRISRRYALYGRGV